jgi:hypothetical protein
LIKLTVQVHFSYITSFNHPIPMLRCMNFIYVLLWHDTFAFGWKRFFQIIFLHVFYYLRYSTLYIYNIYMYENVPGSFSFHLSFNFFLFFLQVLYLTLEYDVYFYFSFFIMFCQIHLYSRYEYVELQTKILVFWVQVNFTIRTRFLFEKWHNLFTYSNYFLLTKFVYQ